MAWKRGEEKKTRKLFRQELHINSLMRTLNFGGQQPATGNAGVAIISLRLQGLKSQTNKDFEFLNKVTRVQLVFKRPLEILLGVYVRRTVPV